VETSDFTNFALPPTDKMAVVATDSLMYYFAITRRHTGFHALLSSITTAGVDVSTHPTEVALTIVGADAIAMGSAETSFTDARQAVLSLTSPLPLLYATTLTKIHVHRMPDPTNPRFLRIYRVPKAPLEEGEVPPQKNSIPHTSVVVNRTDLAIDEVADTITWATSGLSLKMKSRPIRHRHITERHKIIFASVILNAHCSSIIGGSAKIFIPVDRSAYLAPATESK
jgi:hypothetical protein